MAVYILQQPSQSISAANSEILYSVSSSNALQPQFSYVCDLYNSESGDFVTRLTQVPNPTNNATFNLKNITKGEIEYKDYKKQPAAVGNVVTSSFVNEFYDENILDLTSSRIYNVEFGEAYSTSESSSVTFYPNLTSSKLVVFPGVWDANDPNDPLFNTIGVSFPITKIQAPFNYEFPTEILNFEGTPDNNDHQLTDNPYLLTRGRAVYGGDDITVARQIFSTIGQNDYHTISVFTNNIGSSVVPDYAVYFVFSGSFFAGTGFGALTIEVSQSIDNINNVGAIRNFGVGPANITDFVNSGKPGFNNPHFQAIVSGSWTSYDVLIIPGVTFQFLNESYTYNRDAASSLATAGNWIKPRPSTTNAKIFYPFAYGTERLRFAFINRYGVWDYFTCYGALKRNTTLEKDMVNLPRVNYSNSTSPFDPTSRGLQDYFTDFTDSYSIVTQPLDQYEAQWLTQLFDSPLVSVQQGSDFVPILVTNSQYTSNLNTSRNKDFNYTIEFRPAKGREIYSSPTPPCLPVL